MSIPTSLLTVTERLSWMYWDYKDIINQITQYSINVIYYIVSKKLKEFMLPSNAILRANNEIILIKKLPHNF